MITFIPAVLIPLAFVVFYFAFLASDMYRAQAQFSVRGLNQSPLAELGFLALPGANAQAGDSYIIADYITSEQLIRDLKDDLNIDLRQYYSGSEVDFLYRIDPAMPIEEFQRYWKWLVEVSFNSTTGNTELLVYAFSAEDAKLIADSVLRVSENLVNELSIEARRQLISAAEEEVRRTQRRLAEVRRELLEFRDREQAFDPNQLVQLEVGVVKDLRAQLSELRTRRLSLSGALSSNSPALRVIDSEVEAVEAQIAEQMAKIGSGEQKIMPEDAVGGRRLSSLLDEYLNLTLNEEFAANAYTSALTALETANTDARKQQRYFATYVHPRAPAVPMYPRRLLSTLIVAFWLICAWAVIYFVLRSARDHAI